MYRYYIRLHVHYFEFKERGSQHLIYFIHTFSIQSLTIKHQKAIERYGRLTGVTFTYCTDDYVAAMEEGLPSKLLVLCPENVDTLYDRLKEELGSSNESKEGGKQMAAVINGTPAFFVEILKNDVCKGQWNVKEEHEARLRLAA